MDGDNMVSGVEQSEKQGFVREVQANYRERFGAGDQ